ncbi:hypothetical protein HK102_005269, partial [Quaeritorhiza haematococci]
DVMLTVARAAEVGKEETKVDGVEGVEKNENEGKAGKEEQKAEKERKDEEDEQGVLITASSAGEVLDSHMLVFAAEEARVKGVIVDVGEFRGRW